MPRSRRRTARGWGWWRAPASRSGAWVVPVWHSRWAPAGVVRRLSNTCSRRGPRGDSRSMVVEDWRVWSARGREATSWCTWASSGVPVSPPGGRLKSGSEAGSGFEPRTTGGDSRRDGARGNETAARCAPPCGRASSEIPGSACGRAGDLGLAADDRLAEPLAQHAHLHELGLTQSGVALGEVLHGIVQPLFLMLGLGVGDAAAHDVTEQLIARLLGQRWSRSAIRLLPVAHAPSFVV